MLCGRYRQLLAWTGCNRLHSLFVVCCSYEASVYSTVSQDQTMLLGLLNHKQCQDLSQCIIYLHATS